MTVNLKQALEFQTSVLKKICKRVFRMMDKVVGRFPVSVIHIYIDYFKLLKVLPDKLYISKFSTYTLCLSYLIQTNMLIII